MLPYLSSKRGSSASIFIHSVNKEGFFLHRYSLKDDAVNLRLNLVDYLLSLLEHLPSRLQPAFPLDRWKAAARACRLQHVSWW